MKQSLLTYLIITLLSLFHTIFSDENNQNIELRIYNLKSVFVYNFTKYINWPEFEKKEFFTITVLGDNQIFHPLKLIAEKKMVSGKKIKVKLIKTVQEIEPCEILFISGSFTDDIKIILKKINGKNVLTIGDSSGLCKKGIGICLFPHEGGVKFELSQKVLREAGLTASSQLLKLAILVDKEGEK